MDSIISYHEVDDILSLDLKEYGKSFNCVYMDPPLLLPNEEPTPGKIHIDDLVSTSCNSIKSDNGRIIYIFT